jgi:phosphoglucosamine mutase
LGIAATPAVLRTAQEMGAGSAVVITASHNAAKYNGWKGTLGADKPVGDQVDAISERYWAQVDSGLTLPLTADSVRYRPDLTELYKKDVVADIERSFGERPLKGKRIVVDGANGAASKVTPDVLRRLGATVEEFACDGSGPINKGCGATDLSGAQEFLRQRPGLVENANFIGVVANDGDGDRMVGLGVESENGRLNFEGLVLDGNRIIELFAQGQPGTVGTHYTNDAVITRLCEQDIKFDFCENGDVNVTAALRKWQANGHNWTRGGEASGHNVDTPWLSSGDGVRNAAWVASYAAVHNTNFAELCRNMSLWPQIQQEVKYDRGIDAGSVLSSLAVKETIEQAKQQLQLVGGRTLTRRSGTEPVFRVMGVGRELSQVETAVSGIVTAIQSELVRAA